MQLVVGDLYRRLGGHNVCVWDGDRRLAIGMALRCRSGGNTRRFCIGDHESRARQRYQKIDFRRLSSNNSIVNQIEKIFIEF